MNITNGPSQARAVKIRAVQYIHRADYFEWAVVIALKDVVPRQINVRRFSLEIAELFAHRRENRRFQAFLIKSFFESFSEEPIQGGPEKIISHRKPRPELRSKTK